jgi:hypothetical protein
MINNVIVTIDNVEKVVTDLLLYIEKETDIQFEYSTIGGTTELISIESSNSVSPSCICPAEVYTLDSYNYSTLFVIYVCECDGRSKIIEIALLPFDSYTDKYYVNATVNLTEILPDISITHKVRKSENDLDEADYAIF